METKINLDQCQIEESTEEYNCLLYTSDAADEL